MLSFLIKHNLMKTTGKNFTAIYDLHPFLPLYRVFYVFVNPIYYKFNGLVGQRFDSAGWLTKFKVFSKLVVCLNFIRITSNCNTSWVFFLTKKIGRWTEDREVQTPDPFVQLFPARTEGSH